MVHEDVRIGTAVGTIAAVDRNEDEAFTFSLVQGSGDDDMHHSRLMAIFCVQIRHLIIMNKTNSLSRICVLDLLNNVFEQVMTIQIQDIPFYKDVPDQPNLQSTTAGDGTVSLNWSPVDRASTYTLFQSTNSGIYAEETVTVSDSVYSYEVTGLMNGSTYYFILIATNAEGDSPASNEVSATPQALATSCAHPTNGNCR